MSVPYWRYVRYTDDGSALYQCLNCYNEWDARTAPGWFDRLLKVDDAVEGGWSNKRQDGSVDHYATRKTPKYKEVWKFCPCCGVEWKGAIRCDDQNEYMLGPRRLALRDAVNRYHGDKERDLYKLNWQEREKIWTDTWRSPPSYWWVLQERWSWMTEWKEWEDKEYYYGGLMPVKKMLCFLRERREALKLEIANSMFGFPKEQAQARLIVRRGALPKPKGYEVRNYA